MATKTRTSGGSNSSGPITPSTGKDMPGKKKNKPKKHSIKSSEEYGAYTLTKLLSTVNPNIDEDQTYALVFEYLGDKNEIFGPERAVELGQMIIAASAQEGWNGVH